MDLQETLSFNELFDMINLEYYRKEEEKYREIIYEINGNYPQHESLTATAKTNEINYYNRMIDNAKKTREKYNKLIGVVNRLQLDLKHLVDPIAELDAFRHYLFEYNYTILANKDDGLGRLKIKFKAFSKLENKSIKLSRKIYDILNKKMSMLELIDPKNEECSIFLEDFMKDHGVYAAYHIEKMFDKEKNEVYRQILADATILNNCLEKFPKMKQQLKNQTYDDYFFSKFDNLVSGPYKFVDEYEEILNLKKEYSEEFDKLGYDEILLECNRYLSLKLDLEYLTALDESFGRRFYLISEEVKNKQVYKKFRKFLNDKKEKVLNLARKIDEKFSEYGRVDGMKKSLETLKELNDIYSKYLNLYNSLKLWSLNKNDDIDFDPEETLISMRSLASNYSLVVWEMRKHCQKKYNVININEAEELYQKGLLKRQKNGKQSKQKIKSNKIMKPLSFSKSNNEIEEKKTKQTIDKEDIDRQIMLELQKLPPNRYLTQEEEQIRRACYKEYLKAKYSGANYEDFVSYLYSNWYPNVPKTIVIYEEIERDMKRLVPIDHLNDEQQQIRRNCFRSYLEQKYLFRSIDSSVSFLDYLKDNHKDLEWLIVQEEIRFHLVETVYESYLKHCMSVGGKKNTISFSEYAEKYEGYTRNDMLCIYSDNQAESRGLYGRRN